MIYNFEEKNIPTLNEIGGKAKGLMETTLAGFPVHAGLVLSVDFFKPWLDQIRSSTEWNSLLDNISKSNCDLVKEKAYKMTFNEEQIKLLNISIKNLSGKIFAVRSSSPEEDLMEISFAGMYKTYLGVLEKDLEKSIVLAFSSAFDFRVMEYKLKNNLNISDTSIAIIIQEQIASDISGVGFSINPINNAFDEVFINASYGLGESIVSGLVTPDTYIVDGITGKTLEKNIGSKSIAIFLKDNGGIKEVVNRDSDLQALKDSQILELSLLIKRCETYYNKPIDIEWSFYNDKLYLLQARPVTCYFPFFKELLTEPGENKRFYIDIMMLTQRFDEPMSVLGLELWGYMLDEIKMNMMTPQINGSTPIIYGKEYLSVTAFQKLVGKRQTLAFIDNYDGNLKKIFNDIDLDQHPFQGEVEGTKNFKKKMVKTVISMIPASLKGVFGDYHRGISEYNEVADEILSQANSLEKTNDFSTLSKDALDLMIKAMGTAAVIFAGLISKRNLNKIFEGEDVEKEISAMNMNLDGNPTSEMGYLMFHMANSDSFKNICCKQVFIDKVENRSFEKEFLDLFDEFMKKYSMRGFKEIDIASKRIYEDIGILYNKLLEINTEDNQILNIKEKRQKAYDQLLAVAKKKGKEKKFINAEARLRATFGYREHPKYLIVVIIAKLHNICLEIGEELVSEGRLDKKYHIFDLYSDEISKAQKDSTFDLRKVREKNLSGYLYPKEWPLVIDSRGKIYKAELDTKDGDFIGDAISPGSVIGPAKVLHSPYEKPLNSGEILVVRATEPSWTPIFTNAAGVVMEIGSPLQHGGIIAREYGIPCVSGLMGIMDIIQDGDILEVDGSNGFVRLLKDDILSKSE